MNVKAGTFAHLELQSWNPQQSWFAITVLAGLWSALWPFSIDIVLSITHGELKCSGSKKFLMEPLKRTLPQAFSKKSVWNPYNPNHKECTSMLFPFLI